MPVDAKVAVDRGRTPDGQVLPPCLVGRGPPRREVLGRRLAQRDPDAPGLEVGVVVFHLVVVPGDDPGVGGVGGLQVGIELVHRVEVPVLLEGEGHGCPLTVDEDGPGLE